MAVTVPVPDCCISEAEPSTSRGPSLSHILAGHCAQYYPQGSRRMLKNWGSPAGLGVGNGGVGKCPRDGCRIGDLGT